MVGRIRHHSFAVLEELPVYAKALEQHFYRVAREATEVVLHARHPDTCRTNDPRNDIRHSCLRVIHSQQFVVAAIEAEEQQFDALAIMTLPEPSRQDGRAIVDIAVVGYGEGALRQAHSWASAAACCCSAARPHR